MSRRPLRQRPAGTSPLSRAPLTAQVEPLRVGGQPDPGTPAEPESQTTRVTDSQSPAVTDDRTPRAPEAGATDVPRYLTLVRKEARVRDDQAAALAALRRRIVRSRTDRSEPITDNTLIRVAIDLLLARADQLAGDTEEELLRSVLPDSQTP